MNVHGTLRSWNSRQGRLLGHLRCRRRRHHVVHRKATRCRSRVAAAGQAPAIYLLLISGSPFAASCKSLCGSRATELPAAFAAALAALATAAPSIRCAIEISRRLPRSAAAVLHDEQFFNNIAHYSLLVLQFMLAPRDTLLSSQHAWDSLTNPDC